MTRHTPAWLSLVSRCWRLSAQHRSRILSLALVVVLALAYSSSGAIGGGAAISHAATDMRPMPTQAFTLAPKAKGVPAHWSKTVAPRSAAETKTLQANQARMPRLQAPTLSLSHQKAVDPARLNPPVAAPARLSSTRLGVPTGPLADADPVIEQRNVSTGNGTGPAYPCTLGACSPAAAPSVAGFGTHLMESYNNYDALSSDGGTTWSYLNPGMQFTGVGVFEGEQQVLYEPSRNTMYWTQIYEESQSNWGGVGIATATGTNLSSWCFYYLTPATFGYSDFATIYLNTSDLEFTNDYLFLTLTLSARLEPTEAVVARMPLTTLSSCGTLSGTTFISTDFPQFALTQGAQGTMWLVADYYGSAGGTGSSLHLCQWQDLASSPSCVDRTIPAFNFLNGPNAVCASQDGVVTNWCSYLSSFARSVFFTKANFRGFGPATLGVALSVGPAGTGGSDIFPWVAIYYFEAAGLVYVGEDALYNNGFAIAFPSFASNSRGWIGFTASYGGGTGSGGSAVDYYPGTLYGLEDPANPTPPFSTWADAGASNALYWGYFTTTRPLYPSALQFLAGVWAQDNMGNILVGEAIIDRGRDHGAYLRWNHP